MGTNFIVSVKMPSENTQLISLKKSCFFKKDMGGYSQNCLICRDENLLIIHEKLWWSNGFLKIFNNSKHLWSYRRWSFARHLAKIKKNAEIWEVTISFFVAPLWRLWYPVNYKNKHIFSSPIRLYLNLLCLYTYIRNCYNKLRPYFFPFSFHFR